MLTNHEQRICLLARQSGKTRWSQVMLARYLVGRNGGGRFGRMRRMLFAAVKEVTR